MSGGYKLVVLSDGPLGRAAFMIDSESADAYAQPNYLLKGEEPPPSVVADHTRRKKKIEKKPPPPSRDKN